MPTLTIGDKDKQGSDLQIDAQNDELGCLMALLTVDDEDSEGYAVVAMDREDLIKMRDWITEVLG